MKISEQIEQLRNTTEKIQTAFISRLNEIEKDIETLAFSTNIAKENWAGNWFQYSDVYKNFIQNRNEHINLQYDQLLDFVVSNCKIDYVSLEKEIKSILKEFKNNTENVIVELSVIKSNEQFNEQNKILLKLEEYEWGVPAFKIVDSQKPKKFMGDYNTAQRILAEGLTTPPHISLQANLLSNASEIIAMKENLKLIFRLLREIELLINVQNDVYIDLENPISNLNRIFDNFHDVARLLINRHGGRETIKINDEYDVQDLLRSLLKIFFDDLRPEEFTPSYAGRNTRVDFLLKKEKIIIEVKKTRDGLKDKEVGDELLQDIARYKNHPDCDVLFCFVYDPQGHISNPRGLENDLTSESTEKMKVMVSIRP